MKKFLEKLLNEARSQATELENGLIEAETKEERAAINKTLTEVRGRIVELEKQIASVDDESPMDNITNPNSRMNPLFTSGAPAGDDHTNTVEYRTAFMNLVTRNVPIPAELRADANTLTSDVASVIPTHLVNQIIEKMEECGMILPLVTRTSFAGGVVVPTSSVKPVATWVAEGAGSDRQKKTTGSITFSKFKLRCEISMSVEVGTMALAVFEKKFVENVAKAMVIARETAIINGTGSGQPTGILKQTAPTGQALTIAAGATNKITYQTLVEAEAAVPAEYESSAKWCMTKKSFMRFAGMVDGQGQPIARVNYGIGGKIERTLLGREVVVAPYLPNYEDTATSDLLFAFIYDFADYIENTVYDLGIQKKQDWDTEDLLTKAVMSVDGKSINNASLVTLTKTKTA